MTPQRLVLSFLLSMNAIGHATMTLGREPLLTVGLTLGLAALAGAWLHGSLSIPFEPRLRQRILGAVGVLYFGTMLFIFALVLDDKPEELRTSVSILLACQTTFLLFAGADRNGLGLNANTLLAVGVAALAGGTIATTAIVVHAILFAFWLVFDHHERWGAPVVLAWRAALVRTAAVAVLLIPLLLLLPPGPYHRRAGDAPTGATVHIDTKVYAELLAWCAGAVALTWIGLWILRRLRGKGRDARNDRVDARRSRERRLRTPGTIETCDLPGRSGKAARLYLNILEQAKHRGILRPPECTPSEFGPRLPAEAADLTEVFVLARYGPEEITPDEFHRAELSSERTRRVLEG